MSGGTVFPIQTELAWAAGFFDGEGCVSVAGTEYRVTINQVDRRPLDRFVSAVGRGKLLGPYSRKNPNHRPLWVVSYSAKSARIVMETLWPYMSDPKREQAHAQWTKCLERKKAFLKRQELTRGPRGHLVSLALSDLEKV